MASQTDVAGADILIVDDLEENIVLLGHLLRNMGFKPHGASSGEEALERIAENPPDAILLDLVMPGMDGIEVCEKLKSDEKTRHIAVIIITGMTEREVNVRALDAGADDFVQKPFDSVLLEARIRNAVRSKRLHDKIFEYQRQLETHNINLEQSVEQRTRQILTTQQVTVFSLAKLAESRDNETGDHLERMRCYAREVAQELVSRPEYQDEYDDDFIEQIFFSSPLHDIGKVGIPDSILLKPGKLTKEEFDIMKTHSVIGGDTLAAADDEAGTNSFLAMGRDIAYSHHERWDGTGYPHGLKGEEIPLSSRIVAVADVYDALSSKRPYKEPFSHEKSMKIIHDGRGTQFDPDVLDAFECREPEIIAIREKFQASGRLAPIQALQEQLGPKKATA